MSSKRSDVSTSLESADNHLVLQKLKGYIIVTGEEGMRVDEEWIMVHQYDSASRSAYHLCSQPVSPFGIFMSNTPVMQRGTRDP